jgi:hypothetical protein
MPIHALDADAAQFARAVTEERRRLVAECARLRAECIAKHKSVNNANAERDAALTRVAELEAQLERTADARNADALDSSAAVRDVATLRAAIEKAIYCIPGALKYDTAATLGQRIVNFVHEQHERANRIVVTLNEERKVTRDIIGERDEALARVAELEALVVHASNGRYAALSILSEVEHEPHPVTVAGGEQVVSFRDHLQFIKAFRAFIGAPK